MASEVENQKHRLKISSNNNRQANSQEQLTSNRSNMDNQKKQVASLKQSLLPSTPPPSFPPSSPSPPFSTTNKQHENSSNQLNHSNHESASSSSTSSPDFTLAVTSSRSQDQSDLQSTKFQEKEHHQIDQDEEAEKHHVGPVMGIFFKVWSLVKGKLLDKMGVLERMYRMRSTGAKTLQSSNRVKTPRLSY